MYRHAGVFRGRNWVSNPLGLKLQAVICGSLKMGAANWTRVLCKDHVPSQSLRHPFSSVLFLFETGACVTQSDSNLLCSRRWPWISDLSPVSTSGVLGLLYTTIPRPCRAGEQTLPTDQHPRLCFTHFCIFICLYVPLYINAVLFNQSPYPFGLSAD